jgi:hypothetical protein
LSVPELIKEYLGTYDVLIVPKLGTFTLEYKPARINEFTKTIVPPSKLLTFNFKETEDDGRFVSFSASFLNVTNEEAQTLIDNYVSQTLVQLNNGKIVSLGDLGMLMKRDDQLRFTALTQENLNQESYGLKEIHFDEPVKKEIKPVISPVTEPSAPIVPPITEKEQAEPVKVFETPKPKPETTNKKEIEKVVELPKPEKKVEVKPEKRKEEKIKTPKEIKKEPVISSKSKSSAGWVITGALSALLVALIFIFFFTDVPQSANLPDIKKWAQNLLYHQAKDAKDAAIDSIAKQRTKHITDSIAAIAQHDSLSKDTAKVSVAKINDVNKGASEAKPAEKETKQKPVIATPSVKAEIVGTHYYIIAGSFKSEDNAKKLVTNLKKQGYPAEMIVDGGWFRTSYKSFTDKNQATSEMHALQQKGTDGIWLLTKKK